jgi:hypothetical protein
MDDAGLLRPGPVSQLAFFHPTPLVGAGSGVRPSDHQDPDPDDANRHAPCSTGLHGRSGEARHLRPKVFAKDQVPASMGTRGNRTEAEKTHGNRLGYPSHRGPGCHVLSRYSWADV